MATAADHFFYGGGFPRFAPRQWFHFSLPTPQYEVAPSGAHYQLRNKKKGGAQGTATAPCLLLGCANWSHCICPCTSSSRPGRGEGWGGLMTSGSCTTGQSGWESQGLDEESQHHRAGRRPKASRAARDGSRTVPSSSLLLFPLCAFHLLSLPSNLASSHHLPAVSVPLFVLRGYGVSQLSLPLLCIFIFISLLMIITKPLPF